MAMEEPIPKIKSINLVSEHLVIQVLREVFRKTSMSQINRLSLISNSRVLEQLV